MKKLIVSFWVILLLLFSFTASLHADEMSWEDRIIFDNQLESTPIGEADPWGEIESAYIPDIGIELPDQESLAGSIDSENITEAKRASIIDESVNVLRVLGGMIIDVLESTTKH